MEIILNFVQKSQKSELYLPYYKFFERLYGKSITSRFSKAALKDSNAISALIRVVDSNFNSAVNAVDETFKNINCAMLGAYSPENELLAVGRIKFGVPNNERNAIVGEIVVIDDELSDCQRTELYGAFINVVEKTVTDSLKSIDLLTFEVPKNDEAFLTSIEEQGYDIDEVESQHHLTCLFDKRIREKQMKRTLNLETSNK